MILCGFIIRRERKRRHSSDSDDEEERKKELRRKGQSTGVMYSMEFQGRLWATKLLH